MSEYPDRKRECLLFLAMANYKIAEYRKALTHIKELIAAEPNNQQALALKEKIDAKLSTGNIELASSLSFNICILDGIIGMALVGGVAAATVGILIAAFRSRRR